MGAAKSQAIAAKHLLEKNAAKNKAFAAKHLLEKNAAKHQLGKEHQFEEVMKARKKKDMFRHFLEKNTAKNKAVHILEKNISSKQSWKSKKSKPYSGTFWRRMLPNRMLPRHLFWRKLKSILWRKRKMLPSSKPKSVF